MPTVWPPQGEASFEFKMPCCECAQDCFLTMPTLLIDGDDTPYADATAAAAALAAQVASCLVEQTVAASGDVIDLFTASFATGTSVLSIARTDSTVSNPQAGGGSMLFRCIATAAGGISIDYSLTPNASPTFLVVDVNVYDTAGSLIDSASDIQFDTVSLSGTFNLTIPTDGQYDVKISYGTGPSMNLATQLVFTADAYSAGAFSVCPVRAAYADTFLECTP